MEGEWPTDGTINMNGDGLASLDILDHTMPGEVNSKH